MGDNDTQDESSHSISRRTILKSSGVASGLAGLAGCMGGGQQQGSANTTDTPTKTESKDTKTGTDSDKDPIKLGFMMPLTGKWGLLGQDVRPSIQMVVQQVNNQGGINGRPVKLYVEDTKGNPSAGLVAARKLLNSANVDMMIGPSSFTIMQVRPLIMEADIPWMVPCSGTKDLIKYNDMCGPYRTISNDNIGGWAAAINARFKKFNGVKDFKRFGVFTCKSADCKSLANTYTKAHEKVGGTHVGTVELPSGSASYQTQIRKMRNMDPDIVYTMASPPVVKKLMRTAVQVGYNTYWNLPSDFSSQQFLSDVPDQLRDKFFTYIDTSPKGVNEEVKSMYQKQYKKIAGEKPATCWHAAVDATNVLMVAAKAASVKGSVNHKSVCNNIRDVSSPGGKTAYTYKQAAESLENGNEVDLYGIISDLNFTENGEINVPFNVLVPNSSGSEYKPISTISVKTMQKARNGKL